MVYSAGTDKNKNVKEVEVAVGRTDKNLRNIELELQPEKTQLVDFNRMGDIDERVKIKIQDR